MSDEFFVMYVNGWCGVTRNIGEWVAWVVEPEYTRKQALAMAKALNENQDLDPDELTRIVEAA